MHFWGLGIMCSTNEITNEEAITPIMNNDVFFVKKGLDTNVRSQRKLAKIHDPFSDSSDEPFFDECNLFKEVDSSYEESFGNESYSSESNNDSSSSKFFIGDIAESDSETFPLLANEHLFYNDDITC